MVQICQWMLEQFCNLWDEAVLFQVFKLVWRFLLRLMRFACKIFHLTRVSCARRPGWVSINRWKQRRHNYLLYPEWFIFARNFTFLQDGHAMYPVQVWIDRQVKVSCLVILLLLLFLYAIVNQFVPFDEPRTKENH